MPRIHYEIPDDLHRRAKAAAAMEGITLKELLERGLELAILELSREGTQRAKPAKKAK